MIRAFFCLLEIFLFLVLGLPVLGILWIWKRFAPGKASRAAQRCGGWILGVITRTAMGGERFEVRGLENIPAEGGVLFVSNHRSFFDIITAYPILPVQTGFISKAGLWKVPSLRRWMQLLNCQFLNRDDIRQGFEVIRRAAEQTKVGTSFWICPEGTRNPDPDNTTLLEFHEASFKIAERSGCRIVPVALYGTDRLWEAQFPRVRPYPVTIEFGEAFAVKELGAEWKRRAGVYTAGKIREMLLQERARRAHGGV